jgi:hypothetical protein
MHKVELGSAGPSETEIAFIKLDFDRLLDSAAMLKPLLNADAFEQLLERAFIYGSASAQTNIDRSLINTISELLSDSDDELSKAIEAIGANEVNAQHMLLSRLATEWKNASDDIKKKQRLQTMLKASLENVINNKTKLLNIVASTLCPNITIISSELDTSAEFYQPMINKLKLLNKDLISGKSIDSLKLADDSSYLELLSKPTIADFESALSDFSIHDAAADDIINNTLVPETILTGLTNLRNLATIKNKQVNDKSMLASKSIHSMTVTELNGISFKDDEIKNVFNTLLYNRVCDLDKLNVIDSDYAKAYNVLRLENQLLDEIRAKDLNREFYYNAPVAASLAIDLNDSISSQNTLMNPHMNFDINNVNNSFVISKLDINFLDSGIQIARSSRLN